MPEPATNGAGVDRARMEGGPGKDKLIGDSTGKTAQRAEYKTATTAVEINLAEVSPFIGKARKRAGSARKDNVGEDTLQYITMVYGSDYE